MATIIDKVPKWYAVYTKSRNEKKVSERLAEKKIDHYLPLQKILKQWSDRKKWVVEPLFKSYIFVFIGMDQYLDVIQTDGVVSFIQFGQKVESIPDKQIQMIKQTLESGEQVEVNRENYQLGDVVQVTKGPLTGLIGSLIEVQGKHKIVIHVEAIGQNLLVTVSVSTLRKLDHKEQTQALL